MCFVAPCVEAPSRSRSARAGAVSQLRLRAIAVMWEMSDARPHQRPHPARHANHNTSRYVELLLRSLSATHAADLDIAVTVVDNDFHDDMTSLRALLDQQHIPLRPSGFSTATPAIPMAKCCASSCSTRRTAPITCFWMRMSVFLKPAPLMPCSPSWKLLPTCLALGCGKPGMARPRSADSRHAIYHRRLHPCCALVRNTALFRRMGRRDRPHGRHVPLGGWGAGSGHL